MDDLVTWLEPALAELKIEQDGANVRLTGAGWRVTATPPQARRMAAILLRVADEAQAAATEDA